MERKPKKRWIALCLLAIPLSAIFIANMGAADPYNFLGRNRPLYSQITAYGAPYETRVYSWPENYVDVLNAASTELLTKNFILSNYSATKEAAFEKMPKVSIYIRSGTATSRSYLGTLKPGGVTVIVMTELPDNWITRLRLKLQGPPPPASLPSMRSED